MKRLATWLVAATLLVAAGCSGEGGSVIGVAPQSSEPSPQSNPTAESNVSSQVPPGPPALGPDSARTPSELALPPLSFRPDAFAVVAFGRNMAELHAAALKGEGYEALTAIQSPTLQLGLGEVAISGDGKLVAYTRDHGYDSKGICVRPVTGGVATCNWGEWGGISLSWRPRTHDLWVRRSSPHEPPLILTFAGGKLIQSDAPLRIAMGRISFSPDGSAVLYSDGSVTGVMQLPLAVTVPINVPGWAEWIDNRRIAVVVDETRVILVDVTGKEQEVARVPLVAPEQIKEIKVSPNGRYLAANFGRFRNALFRYEGSALLDLRSGKWTRIPLVKGWVTDDFTAVVQTDAGLSLYHVDGRPQQPTVPK